MQYLKERIKDCHTDIYDMFKEYYASTVASEGVPPLDYNWPQFFTIERAGALTVITARDDDHSLVGAAIYFVLPHLHHRTHIFATCDTLAVRPSHRGKGIGRTLVQAAEPILKAQGVDTIVHSYREVYINDKPLFPKIGYAPYERSYVKRI